MNNSLREAWYIYALLELTFTTSGFGRLYLRGAKFRFPVWYLNCFSVTINVQQAEWPNPCFIVITSHKYMLVNTGLMDAFCSLVRVRNAMCSKHVEVQIVLVTVRVHYGQREPAFR